MSFIDYQFQDYFDTQGMFDEDNSYPEYDDSFLTARRQKPSYSGGVDWRYEKGGAFYND